MVASDDAPGADFGTGGITDERKKAYKKVTVEVTDVDEDGSISLSAQQPQEDVPLTATLKDQDYTDTGTNGVQLENGSGGSSPRPWNYLGL